MTILFISDLHLGDNSPHLNALFQQFMKDVAQGSEALYILGDLFEVYIGEDDPSPCQQSVLSSLKQLADQGTKVYLMPGNRDFLYSRRGLKRYGIELLNDPYIVEQPQRILLTHGDRLDPYDTAYLRYRKVAQNKLMKALFLLLPLRFRQAIASKLRQKSKATVTYAKDADLSEIERWQDRYQCQTLLHGHTHIPLIQFTHLGSEGAIHARYVLSDWGPDGHYARLTEHEPVTLLRLTD